MALCESDIRSRALSRFPFFSGISLRAAVERVRLMGFNVEVHLIEKVAQREEGDGVTEAS